MEKERQITVVNNVTGEGVTNVQQVNLRHNLSTRGDKMCPGDKTCRNYYCTTPSPPGLGQMACRDGQIGGRLVWTDRQAGGQTGRLAEKSAGRVQTMAPRESCLVTTTSLPNVRGHRYIKQGERDRRLRQRRQHLARTLTLFTTRKSCLSSRSPAYFSHPTTTEILFKQYITSLYISSHHY